MSDYCIPEDVHWSQAEYIGRAISYVEEQFYLKWGVMLFNEEERG